MKNCNCYIRIISLLFIILSISFSCEYKFVELPEITNDSISFKNDIVPIFNNSCNTTGCHVVGHTIIDLSPENAYDDLWAKSLIDTAAPAESELYTKIAGGKHFDNATPTDYAMILKWIEQGANNN